MTDFWDEVTIEFQEEDDGFHFVNPVVMAQYFVKAVGHATQLHRDMEVLKEEVANLTIRKERKQRELAKLRKAIIAANYSESTKSASSEIQDAFVLAKAPSLGKLDELKEIEADIEELIRLIEVREPKIEEIKVRLRALENFTNWGKQYLDFDKLLRRLE